MTHSTVQMTMMLSSRACSSGVRRRMASWYSSRLSKAVALAVAACCVPSLRSIWRAETARTAYSSAGDPRASTGTCTPKARPPLSNMSSHGATWPT